LVAHEFIIGNKTQRSVVGTQTVEIWERSFSRRRQ